jgi:hypothetical protein
VKTLAHPQGGAEHDEPNKKEATHLLGPHVPWNQFGESGKDLQADRDDQKQHGCDKQKMKQSIDQRKDFLH